MKIRHALAAVGGVHLLPILLGLVVVLVGPFALRLAGHALARRRFERRPWRCPECGAEGMGETVLQPRGVLDGKHVRLCTACGAGLLYTLLGGLLLGYPEVIPHDKWALMRAEFEARYGRPASMKHEEGRP